MLGQILFKMIGTDVYVDLGYIDMFFVRLASNDEQECVKNKEGNKTSTWGKTT